jgi:hypothetical protein
VSNPNTTPATPDVGGETDESHGTSHPNQTDINNTITAAITNTTSATTDNTTTTILPPRSSWNYNSSTAQGEHPKEFLTTPKLLSTVLLSRVFGAQLTVGLVGDLQSPLGPSRILVSFKEAYRGLETQQPSIFGRWSLAAHAHPLLTSNENPTSVIG